MLLSPPLRWQDPRTISLSQACSVPPLLIRSLSSIFHSAFYSTHRPGRCRRNLLKTNDRCISTRHNFSTSGSGFPALAAVANHHSRPLGSFSPILHSKMNMNRNRRSDKDRRPERASRAEGPLWPSPTAVTFRYILYTRMNMNRIRRNPLKTNNPCILYSIKKAVLHLPSQPAPALALQNAPIHSRIFSIPRERMRRCCAWG
jgi:hypothetical protein